MVIYHCNLNFDDDENDDDDDDDNIWQYDDDDDFGLILILMMVHASCYNPLVSAFCDSKGGFTPKLAEAYTNHLKDETSSQQGCCWLLGDIQQAGCMLMLSFAMAKRCLGWLQNCQRTQVLAFCSLANLSKQIRDIRFEELHSQGMRKP